MSGQDQEENQVSMHLARSGWPEQKMAPFMGHLSKAEAFQLTILKTMADIHKWNANPGNQDKRAEDLEAASFEFLTDNWLAYSVSVDSEGRRGLLSALKSRLTGLGLGGDIAQKQSLLDRAKSGLGRKKDEP